MDDRVGRWLLCPFCIYIARSFIMGDMEKPRWNTIQLTTKSHESCLSSRIRFVRNHLILTHCFDLLSCFVCSIRIGMFRIRPCMDLYNSDTMDRSCFVYSNSKALIVWQFIENREIVFKHFYFWSFLIIFLLICFFSVWEEISYWFDLLAAVNRFRIQDKLNEPMAICWACRWSV